MAKIYGLNGVLEGKVGNTVFATVGGQNIARKYQPIVANPRTTAQVNQRAKVSLAGQISKGVIPAAIEGLGGTKLKNRRMFLSNLIKAAEAPSNGEAAMILGEEIEFSHGYAASKFNGQAITITGAASDPYLTAQVTLRSTTGAALEVGARCRVVVLFVPNAANEGANCISRAVDVKVATAQQQNMQVEAIFPNNSITQAGRFMAWLVPMEEVAGAAFPVGYVFTPGTQQIAVPSDLVLSGSVIYGDSEYIGDANFQSA